MTRTDHDSESHDSHQGLPEAALETFVTVANNSWKTPATLNGDLVNNSSQQQQQEQEHKPFCKSESQSSCSSTSYLTSLKSATLMKDGEQECDSTAMARTEDKPVADDLIWGRGIKADWDRTVGTWWWEEMTNLQQKTIAVSLFVFFACIAPAVTFGAIYEKSTGHYIGTIEMLTSTAWVSIVYALVGGSPIIIQGATGLVLAFHGVLYQFSIMLDVPFLTLSAWTGLWVMLYCIISAFWNLTKYIQLATRFTDEMYAILIAVIFIVNAMGNPFAPIGLVYYFDPNQTSHDKYQHDPGYYYMSVALLSFILAFGTMFLAIFLKEVKYSRFFCNQWIRTTLSDFSVPIAVFVFTAIDLWGFGDQVPTEKLNVPDTFSPTFTCCDASCDSYWPTDCPDLPVAYGRRPWLVDLFDLNGHTWVIFFSALPAFLAFIVVYFESGITIHLVNHPSHMLTHGCAYNLDTLIIGITIGINSMFGFPWPIAATIRALTHMNALADKTQDGTILSVLETRLSNLLVHMMMGACIFALPILQLISVPILYGVFLYMGITSVATNQFWGRFTMMFMQPSRYPSTPYTQHVSPRQMHKFTIVQLSLFLLMYMIKSFKQIAMAFPIVFALCIPIRIYVFPKMFSDLDLLMLDGDDDEIEAWLAANSNKEDPVESDSDEKQEFLPLEITPQPPRLENAMGSDKDMNGAHAVETIENTQPLVDEAAPRDSPSPV